MVVDRDGPGGAEVAHIRVVRTLADIHRLNEFRDQEVDVGVTLPMAMSGHVDGHAVYLDGKIGAVIKVEAAQEILIGLTLSGVLGDDQAGHDLERLADTRERHCAHLLAGEAYSAGCGRLQGSDAVGRSAGRDRASANARPRHSPSGGRLVRSGYGRCPHPTILRGFGPINPLKPFRLRSGDGDGWKLIRPDGSSLLPSGWQGTYRIRSGGGKYPQQGPTH